MVHLERIVNDFQFLEQRFVKMQYRLTIGERGGDGDENLLGSGKIRFIKVFNVNTGTLAKIVFRTRRIRKLKK